MAEHSSGWGEARLSHFDNGVIFCMPCKGGLLGLGRYMSANHRLNAIHSPMPSCRKRTPRLMGAPSNIPPWLYRFLRS